MFLYQLLITRFRNNFSGLLMITCMLINGNLHADECGFLKIQKTRSPGINVFNNTCTDARELSLQTVVQIQPGARLWLESKEMHQDSEGFQIICQNKSSAPVNIKINSLFLPWINPEGIGQCNDWVNDRLECHDVSNQRKSLLCAIAQIRRSPVQLIQRRTSITVRTVKSYQYQSRSASSENSQDEINQGITYLKPDIDLCRKVFQIDYPITLSWKIKATGKVTDATVMESGIDSQLAECAIEAIEKFNFPLLEKDAQITFTF